MKKRIITIITLIILLTLCAQVFAACSFDEAKYTVTFETNGGTQIPNYSTNIGNEQITKNKLDSLFDEPVKEGYIFGGWYMDNEFTQPFDKFYLTKNTTLYCRWGQAFKVSFNSNGGSSIGDITSNPFGDTVLPTEKPTKSGNLFLGWFLDQDCLTPFDPQSIISSDTTLFAAWTDTVELSVDNVYDLFNITFAVSNSKYDGTGLSYEIRLKDQSFVTLFSSDSITMKIEYGSRLESTLGGTTSVDCNATITLTKKNNFGWKGSHHGSDYYIQIIVGSGGVPSYSDITAVTGTLSSKYAEYKLNFDTRGGNVISPQIINKSNRVEFENIPTPTHESSDYIFNGWYRDELFENKFDSGSIIITQDTTLYAKWDVKYNISFNTMGGTTLENIKSNPLGETVISKYPTMRGCRFDGWYYEEACQNKFDPKNIVAQDITLYAKWKDTFELVGEISEATSNFFDIKTTVTNSREEGMFLTYTITLEDEIYLDSAFTSDTIVLEIKYTLREGFSNTRLSATMPITLNKADGFSASGTYYGCEQYIADKSYTAPIRYKGNGALASTTVTSSTDAKFISGVISSKK